MNSIDDLAFRLEQVRSAIQSYQPRVPEPPILTVSGSNAALQLDGKSSATKNDLPGLRILREEVNRECALLEKFLEDPTRSEGSPSLSTNAPYLIAVWQELVHSHRPIALYRSFFHGNHSQGRIPNRRKPSNRPVKVDVVSENGARWIRINTIKNSRLLMEFHELDSYLTSSSDEEGDHDNFTHRRNLTRSATNQELENSVLQMARELLAAAEANPLPVSGRIPQITLCLTRLNPTLVDDSGTEADPRIAGTIKHLRDMGIDVQLGERSEALLDDHHGIQQIELKPTSNINLDLSALIALVSDISHAFLPHSPDEAQTRYGYWKLAHKEMSTEKALKTTNNHEAYNDAHATKPRATEESEQTRALSRQATQEMHRGFLQDMRDRLSPLAQCTSNCAQHRVLDVFLDSSTNHSLDMSNIKFWTTAEARQRCLQIVAKIGGPRERRRVHALLAVHDCFGSSETVERWDRAAAEAAYWSDSRYPFGFLPLIPVHILSSCDAVASTPRGGDINTKLTPLPSLSEFFSALSATCAKLLTDNSDSQLCTQRPIIPEESHPDPDALQDFSNDCPADIPPAPTLITSKLTAHTVESMYAGASRGWTTLTANRASVRVLLRKMGKSLDTLQRGCNGTTATSPAAIWLVDPRSLAEGMHIDNSN
ncbi:hypothetical protein M404DRAFT_20135 [Pisolithus tinctorius Marx 270]|uniref:DUF1308 domain-containing protein n=1 Tax=Pisolithus tinctorius Marx 270 TaxID=870435 RepID=A0A0C3JQL2_PISTI|nr:hypothetical protein M404DRAFT_20135 [Pisolithus tinctorius Marx 270]